MMLNRLRRNELVILKAKFEADYRMYLETNFGERDSFRRAVLLPKWGHCLPTPEIIDRIVGWYRAVAVENPEVKIYDVGCGTGFLLVMLYLAGIPYDALIGVDLPRSCLPEKTPRYWKVIEDSSYDVPSDGILLISFGEQLNHVLVRYLGNGGNKVILIGQTKGPGSYQKPAADMLVGFREWRVESHVLPSVEVHGNFFNYITFSTR